MTGQAEFRRVFIKHERMSINIESLMIQQARRPEDTLQGYPTHYLTSIIAAEVRKFALPIVNDTDPPNDPAHGLVLADDLANWTNSAGLGLQPRYGTMIRFRLLITGGRLPLRIRSSEPQKNSPWDRLRCRTAGLRIVCGVRCA